MVTFNESTHTYAIDGIPVPSVTQIIGEIVGTAWVAAPWYLERGRAIHKCAEFIIEGKEFKFDERLSGYITALKSFFKIVKPEPIQLFKEPEKLLGEQTVFSLVYRFAGMLDLGCKIGGVKTIIDWKHSIDKNRLPLQLGGYSVALKEMSKEEFNQGIGVQIKENGTFQMTEKIDLRRQRNEFLALRTAYAIKVCCKALSTQKEAI